MNIFNLIGRYFFQVAQLKLVIMEGNECVLGTKLHVGVSLDSVDQTVEKVILYFNLLMIKC